MSPPRGSPVRASAPKGSSERTPGSALTAARDPGQALLAAFAVSTEYSQHLRQIALDARLEVGVCTAGAAERHLGSEVAAPPQVLAAVVDGVPRARQLREIKGLSMRAPGESRGNPLLRRRLTGPESTRGPQRACNNRPTSLDFCTPASCIRTRGTPAGGSAFGPARTRHSGFFGNPALECAGLQQAAARFQPSLFSRHSTDHRGRDP
jgi:hypothetical protein